MFGNLLRPADLDRFKKDSVRLITSQSEDGKIKIGQSRIGGLPDLPATVQWPLREGKPLRFLAQINLQDVYGVVPSSPFGQRGHLAFFYDDIEQPWGGDLKDRNGWAVLCFPDVELVRQTVSGVKDTDEPAHYRWCSVQFRPEQTWPSPGHFEFKSLGKRLARRFEKICSEAERSESSDDRSRMLGYADLIQQEMRFRCQLRLNGITNADLKYLTEEDLAPILAGAADLELLLQLDSDNNPGMMWGDVGRLYFWMNINDIKQGKFDRVWLEMQCC